LLLYAGMQIKETISDPKVPREPQAFAKNLANPNLDVAISQKAEAKNSEASIEDMINSLAKIPDQNLTNESDPENEKLKSSFIEVGNYIRTNYASWFNWATIFLHTTGAVLPYVTVIPKDFSQSLKKFAENFSRFGIPLVKLHTGIEAIYGKRAFEAVARIVPAFLIPALKLPFHNFQLAYGLSSGINVALEHINGRIGEQKKEDDFSVNNQKVIDGLKGMVNDFFQPQTSLKEKSKIGLALGGAACMLGGAIPTLIFDRNGLNDGFAKVFGSIRSFGGLLGDLSIILFSSQPTEEMRKKEKIVGSFFLVPSVMDFAQRWISQDSDANEIFNHAKTALNTIGEVIWSNFSTDRNTKTMNTKTKKDKKADLLFNAA
jgi:hypothetical protein